MANNSIKDTDGLNSTMNLFTNATPTTVNFATKATSLIMGSTSGTATIQNATITAPQCTTLTVNALATINLAGVPRINNGGGAQTILAKWYRPNSTAGTISAHYFEYQNSTGTAMAFAKIFGELQTATVGAEDGRLALGVTGGGTIPTTIAACQFILSKNDISLGLTSTGTITHVGRSLVRSVTDTGPMTATPGTQREIVFNTSSTLFYGCTVTSTSAATWVAL